MDLVRRLQIFSLLQWRGHRLSLGVLAISELGYADS